MLESTAGEILILITDIMSDCAGPLQDLMAYYTQRST